MKPPEKKLPQIRSTAEFARYTGLSRSAVSRVLNNHAGLRPETIARVKRAMIETGFTLNAHAVNLRKKTASVIGVCLEDFNTQTAVSKVSYLQDHLRQRDFTTLIEVIRPGSSRQVVQHFLSLRVDGIIFIGHFDVSELEQRIGELRQLRVPHLIVDHSGADRVPTISLDRVRAMREVTRHLLDLGHRRFGLLGMSGSFQTVVDRLRGVSEELAAHSLDIATAAVSLDYLHVRREHFEYGRALAASFAQADAMPTAFIAVNDETAIGALLEFQRRRIRIPADISITGFNNQNICLMTTPCLTSVDQQIELTMQLATESILQQIRKLAPQKMLSRSIPPRLVHRQSTGPARRD